MFVVGELRWGGVRFTSSCDTCKLVSVHYAEVDDTCARSARSPGPAKSARDGQFTLFTTVSMLSKHTHTHIHVYSMDNLSVDRSTYMLYKSQEV